MSEKAGEKTKAVAVLTIRDGGKMTPAGRRRVADWIREQADDLQSLGAEYSSVMRARYLIASGK